MDVLAPFAPFGVALLVALVVTPLAMRLARAVGAVDRPSTERWHRSATPLLGGAAIVAGMLAGLATAGVPGRSVAAVAGGSLLLFVTGLVDDVRRLRPATKLVAQIAATGVLLALDVRAGWPEVPVLSVIATFFWVVGITNAMNLLDNMDGLAAGVAAISGVSVAACAALVPGGREPAVLVALATAGAAAGFLPWNRHPARVFMGDAGSLPLGFALAASALLATHREAGQLAFVIAAPLLAMAVPILDTTLVSVLRRWNGRRVSQGGRDHLSHRLVALGVPERQAVRVLWTASAALGGFAVAATSLGWLGTFVLLAIGICASAVLGVALGHAKVYAPADRPADAERFEELRRTFVNYGRILGPFVSDLILAAAAYVSAYLLRYDGVVPAPDQALLERSLPVVVAVQLVALTGFRAYRGVWRYFGVRDAADLARGVLAAAVAATLVLTFGFRESTFSRGVLVMDAVLLAVLLFGVRAASRFLFDAFGGFREDGERVLVVGAGEAGTLCLRALRARGGEPATPVGILDDDPALRRRHIHGVPVLGPTAELARVLAEVRPVEVVLADLPDEERLVELRRVATRAGVRLTLSPYAKAFAPL